MPASRKTGRGGLATDPNPLLGLDALVRAENVYAEADGRLRVRPGFGQQTVKSVSRRARRMFQAFGGDLPVILSVDSGAPALETLSGTISGTPAASGSEYMLADAADARGNWYLTASTGPMKLTSTADTALESAGLRRALTGLLALSSSGTPAAVLTGKAVAYRWCIVREDAGGLVIRSEPSPWQSIENTSGSTRDVTCTIPLAGDVVAGDRIEVYRTAAVASGTTPSDECFLATSYTVVAGDVTAEYATVTDQNPEASLGRALYTNPTREGILRANTRPPVAAQLALFAGCLWYGCMSRAQTLQFQIVNVSPYDSDSLYAATDSVTVPSTTITLSGGFPTNGLRAGQYVWTTDQVNPSVAGSIFAANTTIQSVGAGTITVTPALVGTAGAPITIYIGDRVTIDGVDYFAQVASSQTTTMAGNRVFAMSTSGTPTAAAYAARNLAFAVSYYSDSVMCAAIEEPGSTRSTVICERESQDGASFTVTTTSPSSIVAVSGAALTSSSPAERNMLAYSKPDEPEHVPLLNTITLGSESNHIVRLTSLNGALLAWTREGLYRITGAAPDQWRVDLVDSEVRLLRGECCDVMHGTVYALTQRGLVSADANGVGDVVSGGLVWRELEEYLPSMDNAPEDYADGTYVAAWASRGLVLVAANAGSDTPDAVYCYAATPGVWSKWTVTHRWLSQSRAGMRALRAGSLWEARLAQDGVTPTTDAGYDRSYTSLTWTADGTTTLTITSANAGTWTPTEGDWLSASNGSETLYRRVLAASLAAGTWTLTLDATLAASYSTSRTAYEGVRVWLQYHAQQGPGVLCREMQLELDTSDYEASDASTLTSLRIAAGAGTEHAAETQTAIVEGTRAATRTRRIRMGTPRAVARAQHYFASVSFSEAFIRRLSVLGLVLVTSQIGERGLTR